MPLEFRQFTKETPHDHLVQGAVLISNEIYDDEPPAPVTSVISMLQPIPRLQCTFGLFDGDEVVATGTFSDGNLNTEPPIPPELMNLAVRADYRGRRLGEYFVRRIEQYAAEQGYGALIVYPTSKAEGFYKKLGYSDPDEGNIMERPLCVESVRKTIVLPAQTIARPVDAESSTLDGIAANVYYASSQVRHAQRTLRYAHMLLTEAIERLERLNAAPLTGVVGNLVAGHELMTTVWERTGRIADNLDVYRQTIMDGQ